MDETTNDLDDVDWVDGDDVVELAKEYRDEMAKSLGIVGISHHPSYAAPGEEIRRYPVETVGSPVTKGIGTHRVLTNVTNFDGEDEVAASEDVDYLTVRETTGYAAIQSSATMALGWGTVPTPREVRLGEYLFGLDDRDLQPDGRVARCDVAEEIVEMMFPSTSQYDKADVWVRLSDAPVSNVLALEECVTALRFRDDKSERNHIARYRDDYPDDAADGPLQYRLSISQLVVEKYFDNPTGEHGSESWHRIYSGFDFDEIDAEVEATGYVAEVNEDDEDGTGTSETDTHLVTIPEMKLPEKVLDLPAPEPTDPAQYG